MVQQKADINQRIWQVIALIPQGKVCSYGEIARQAGMPGAARRVGYALRCLPQDTRIPWHRVLGAQGRLSLPEDSRAGQEQRRRLLQEEVAFLGERRVDWRTHRWLPGE